MSSARLEVIKGDADTPARLSRSMPAALDGLLKQAALDDFCDKIDELFLVAHAEYKRVVKRLSWMSIAFYIWIVFFIISIPLMNSWWYIIASTIAMCVYIGIVELCTQPGQIAKFSKEKLRLIRFECDEMTRRTPFVSFHVAAGVVNCNHIDVIISLSLSATASGIATTSNTITEHTSDSKIYKSSDNDNPVVYAQAVTSSTMTNDSYQQLNDVEVV
jgi:hypothetical protein